MGGMGGSGGFAKGGGIGAPEPKEPAAAFKRGSVGGGGGGGDAKSRYKGTIHKGR
jgi:hypothetical protein